jgi:hypothetical protein
VVAFGRVWLKATAIAGGVSRGRIRTLPPAGHEAVGVRPSPGAAGHLNRLISDVSLGVASARGDVSRFSDIAAPEDGRTPGQRADPLVSRELSKIPSTGEFR